ncbi:hypothetical protein ACFVFH_09975 [Streptomyces sp. NPDC057697]|uniref:hypothetical protein n=1 Tax=Streptomyces sp. NPDC057697 TaxID=3346219 RepID=UPI0036925D1A
MSVAATWRRSRMVIEGRSVAARTRRKVSETVSGRSQEPSSRVKTCRSRPRSGPTTPGSSCWRPRCSRSSATLTLFRAIVLALLSVFGVDSYRSQQSATISFAG